MSCQKQTDHGPLRQDKHLFAGLKSTFTYREVCSLSLLLEPDMLSRRRGLTRENFCLRRVYVQLLSDENSHAGGTSIFSTQPSEFKPAAY
jgi:hypothetical protein